MEDVALPVIFCEGCEPAALLAGAASWSAGGWLKELGAKPRKALVGCPELA